MTDIDTSLLEHLDTLIRTCRETERDYRRCAAQAQAMPLQWLLTQRARDLRKAGAEWRALRVQYMGAAAPDEPARHATACSCSDIGSDAALLAECERIEDVALQRLRSVLDEDLPIVIRAVAQRHCDATRDQRAQLRRLRADMLPVAPQPQAQRSPSGLRPVDLESA